MPERIVIAGAGLAGLRCAQAARQAGFEGELVLIGAETHPPYTRPPLSKEILKGERTPVQTAFPGLDTLDATVRLGEVVIGADAAAHTVSLAGGDVLSYDRLIIATGARARGIPRPGPETPASHGFASLRGLDDAVLLDEALGRARHLAIVGAGFIGCEVAASARHRGVEVTLIDPLPQPLAPLGPELGARVARLHRDHGVTLRLGVPVRQVLPGRVLLADDSVVAADHVLVAIGATPNSDAFAQSGIELAPDGGVACDSTLTSVSDPDVLAAGDVVSWPHPGAGGEPVRVEHWTTAAEHGRVAGQNATREPAERAAHVTAPYFWSDQYDCKIQCVGFPARASTIEILEEDADAHRLVAEARDDRGDLVGAITFNSARRLAEYRRRLVAEHA